MSTPPMSVTTDQFSMIEHEIIILFAVWDMIDEMVNYTIFMKNKNHVDTNLMFCTSTDARLCNILLTDFLSVPQSQRSRNNCKHLPFGLDIPPKGGKETNHTYLFYLRKICEAPRFHSDVQAISKLVEAFSDWLDAECQVDDVWLSNISVEANVRASRISLLKICGNIAKHNFSRLQVIVNDIIKIFANSQKVITEQDAFLALPNFYEWFHDHFFIYHSSTIAEFLNNLRWAIFEYLQPEFARSYKKPDSDDIRYTFTFPPNCNQPMVRAMYWELMNKASRKPFFPLFTVDKSFKSLY